VSIVATRHYLVKDRGSLWDKSPVPGMEFQLLVGGEQSEGAYSLMRGEMDHGIPQHIHEFDDESLYILEGNMVAVVGEVNYELSTGDFLYLPRKVPHELLIEEPVRVLSSICPGGVIECLMEEVAEHIESNGGELDVDTYTAIQLKYGISAPNGWVS
jgi:quercetin dioxygenase-like cupin family protein